jgi:hypothetical protein
MSIPKGRHNDWLWPFSYIQRRWTAWESEHRPHAIIGSGTVMFEQRTAGWTFLDITPRGTWALVWPLYFTFRTHSGWHFRTGFRYDYNGMYYTFVPFTLKRLT